LRPGIGSFDHGQGQEKEKLEPFQRRQPNWTGRKTIIYTYIYTAGHGQVKTPVVKLANQPEESPAVKPANKQEESSQPPKKVRRNNRLRVDRYQRKVNVEAYK